MNIIYINSVYGVGSTGKIVYNQVCKAKAEGHNIKVACSTVETVPQNLKTDIIAVGNRADYFFHNIMSRITDSEGLYSRHSTKKLISKIKEFNPDIIYIHNIHGHWLNYEILFDFLAKSDKQIIWHLHDCWAFTGHCAHFSIIKCYKWKRGCEKCPSLKSYPKSYVLDNSKRNYFRKKKAFTSVKKLKIITPSKWLKNLVDESFLNKYPVEVIYNKIDFDVFKPTPNNFKEKYGISDKIMVLGVSNVWMKEKGYYDFFELARLLDDRFALVMVGLTDKQLMEIPKRIIGIKRTKSAEELAEIYTAADIFLNLTYQDTYPTVNIEAIACGTPVVSYITGGSCESFDKYSGIEVEQGNLSKIIAALEVSHKISKENVLNRRNILKNRGHFKIDDN